jgi:hypothetical protein
MDFCVNVYGITSFSAELPDDDPVPLAFYESRHCPDGRGSFWIDKNRLQGGGLANGFGVLISLLEWNPGHRNCKIQKGRD